MINNIQIFVCALITRQIATLQLQPSFHFEALSKQVLISECIFITGIILGRIILLDLLE